MSWPLIILIALIAFGLAAFVLRLPQQLWAAFGAALLFGLAGYAFQGSPSQPSAPKSGVTATSSDNEALVTSRRMLFGIDTTPSKLVILADGYARQGLYEESAGILNIALENNPEDIEAWVALGNVLVEQANGMLTPAARYAYRKAEGLDADNPALAYFSGVALLRMGEPAEAHKVWKQLIDNAPKDAPWLEPVQLQYDRLHGLMTQQESVNRAPGGQ